MTEVFAAEAWYRARPEPEQVWQGRLETRPVVVGPASRTALTYTLETKDAPLAVYTGNQAHVFVPYVGHEVVVHGKLVDLHGEGFGQELWIGSIQQHMPTPPA
jgi:hypothetical protein